MAEGEARDCGPTRLGRARALKGPADKGSGLKHQQLNRLISLSVHGSAVIEESREKTTTPRKNPGVCSRHRLRLLACRTPSNFSSGKILSGHQNDCTRDFATADWHTDVAVPRHSGSPLGPRTKETLSKLHYWPFEIRQPQTRGQSHIRFRQRNSPWIN